jgi:hypothetical protein
MAKVGKILVSIAALAATVALSTFAPGIGTALGVSKFLVLLVGSVVISVGLSLITSLLFRPPSAGADQSKVNVRISEPPRYICGGVAMQGGSVVFGEFDAAGDFWYILIHCDSILTSALQYYFDDRLVTFDGTGTGKGWCNTDEFCLNDKGEPYAGSGTRVPYFYVWTQTYSETNPTPPGVAELQTAFPSKWTTVDHLLVGTTYSVIRCKAIKLADRYKIYKWRGAIGLGEPAVSIAGVYSNMYDPRDTSQVLGNRSTYKPSRNAALVWAWWRTHPFGRGKPESSINWQRIAEQADICDQEVAGIQGTQPRYECGNSIRDDKVRVDAETEIMQSCDGQLVFDDTGLTWLRVGYYEQPTVRLTRNRDIIAMESVEAQDGESVTQGVIVQFSDPATGYALQASAPWYNPNYYKAGEGNTYLTVPIPTIQNHNQAMRVAKAIGMRSQPLHKIGPTAGLRGLRAMHERFVNINYDNTFSGDYEICTPIEVDESGLFCSLGLTPIEATRFDLLAGEEKPKPVYDGVSSEILTPTDPTGVVVDRANGRIEATFPAPSRGDVTYQFQYIAASNLSAGNWTDMSVSMNDLFASSGPITGQSYYVRYRALTNGGTPSAWSANIPLDSSAPAAASNLSLSVNADRSLIVADWTSNDASAMFLVEVIPNG